MALSKVTIGTSATLVLAEGERKGFIVSNLSANTVYLSVSGDPLPTLPSGVRPGVPLFPGERYITTQEDRRSVVSNQAVYGISAAASDVGVEVIT
jgi:hypothetical protein